jgi:hypothetical protein
MPDAPDAPPPVLDGARVIAYAIVDDTVRWTGRQKLFRGDILVGAVPRLALCQALGGDLTDILLFHCDDAWSVEAVSGSPTLEGSKALAERAYAGIGARWVHLDATPEQAHAWLAAHADADALAHCAFCNASPSGNRRFVVFRNASVCEACVGRLGRELRATAGSDPA